MSFLAAKLKGKTMKLNELIPVNNDRCHTILSAVDGLITVKQAASTLQLSERHLRRLISQYKHTNNVLSLIPKGRINKPWNKLDERIEQKIVHLKQENPLRSNQYIAELIQEKFSRLITDVSVKNILLRNDCYERRPIKRRVYKKVCVGSFGEMFQMDTCEGAWLKGYRRVNLICIMDAYSRYIVGWKWSAADGVWDNIAVLRAVIEKYGRFRLLYTDNASFFKVIRHDRSIHQKHKPDDEYETAIQRMTKDLGILMVCHKPRRPEGKGRIERFFRTMQGRFIREHTARNLEELNRQFKKWVSWYNNQHVIRTIGVRPKDRLQPSVIEPVPVSGEEFNKIFSYQYTRKVDKFNSFSFQGRQYLIDKKNCKVSGGHLVARTISLFVNPETITVYHHNSLIQRFERIAGEQTKLDQFIK
jgi:putative transposase